MAPTVVSGVRQKWQHQQQLPQLSAEMDNGGDGSPSHWGRWMTVATATIPPPVVGGDGCWWQWVPQLPAEKDGDDPKCVLARTTIFSKQVTFTSFAARSPWFTSEVALCLLLP